MAGLQSVEELESNLTEYRGQLQQLEELLLNDPENEELQQMYNSLQEVIELTQDLLKDAKAAETAAPADAVTASTSADAAPSTSAGGDAAGAAISLPSILPASVAEQIRKAQIKAALLGQAPAAWAIGARCQALYGDDGQYYDATVEGVSPEGNFIIVYDGYGNKEEVGLLAVRPPPEASEVYKGVAAPKRNRVEDTPVVTEIPKWLEVKDTDDEKTKARKKKLLKSFKSKIRFQTMDVVQKEKADTWKSFMQGKGTKRKAGFFTGTKKQSMFAVPDNGKVGVIGSGKGMTDYQKRSKHEFNLEDAE